MLKLILKKGIAFFLDFFFANVFFWIVALPLIYLFGKKNPDDANTIDISGPLGYGLMLWYISLLIVFPALMEYKSQATFGHNIVGLRIVRIDGKKITFLTALKRRLTDTIEIFLTSGVIVVFLNLTTSGYRRMGDLWAGTVVVEKDAEYPTAFIEPTKIE
jgi:uncharacterized RDD family membrane protein YckC